MTEENKYSQQLNQINNMLGDLNHLSSQLENKVLKSNSLIKNGKLQDDFADFTEFEDENGNILLIKYSTREFEFRGNKYCKYILCNEKTGSREEGVAQINGGQHVHIKDEERKQKITEYINHVKQEQIAKYCKNQAQFKNYNDLKYVGYIEEKIFKNLIMIVYQIGNSKYFCFYDIEENKCYPCDFKNLKELLSESTHVFIKNPNYQYPNEETLYDKTYRIKGKDINLNSIKTTEWGYHDDETGAGEEYVSTLYHVIGTNAYVILTKFKNNDEEPFIDDCDTVFDLDNLIKDGKLVKSENELYDLLTKTNKDYRIETVLLILSLVLLLYPLTEFILWIVAHVFPLFWSDKFSATGVTEFATKYLPYAYHPNLKWFSHFSVNALCVGLFLFLGSKYNDTREKVFLIIGTILSIGFLCIMFIPNAFDFVGNISTWLVGIGIGIAVLIWIGSHA